MTRNELLVLDADQFRDAGLPPVHIQLDLAGVFMSRVPLASTPEFYLKLHGAPGDDVGFVMWPAAADELGDDGIARSARRMRMLAADASVIAERVDVAGMTCDAIVWTKLYSLHRHAICVARIPYRPGGAVMAMFTAGLGKDQTPSAAAVVSRDRLRQLARSLRVTRAKAPVVERTFANGEYHLGEALHHGLCRARRADGGPGRFLATITSKQKPSYEALYRALHVPVGGVATIRWIGPLETLAEDDVLVEDEPPGVPTTEADGRPHNLESAIRLAIAVADVVRQIHLNGVVCGYLRPQLIYAEVHAVLHLRGLTWRPEVFRLTATPASHIVLPMFEDLYIAPELLRGTPLTPAADVFSLCAIVIRWISGVPPFIGNSFMDQAASVFTNRRAPWSAPAWLVEVIEAGLEPEATKRPSLDELANRLQAGLRR
jgi:hypothetical protein